MAKIASGMEFCNSCVHFGYCMVYWGVECKRQGGKRIPRMKPTPADILERDTISRIPLVEVRKPEPPVLNANVQSITDKPKTTRKPEMLQKIVNIFEPIRTKVANW